MRKFVTIIFKEILLLWRDKVGLLVLFALPAMLVLFISLIQPSNSLKSQHIKLLVIDQDGQHVGRAVRQALLKMDLFEIQAVVSRSQSRLEQAKTAVQQGKQQALLVIPRYSTQHNRTYIRDLNNPRMRHIKTNAALKVYIDGALPLAISSQVDTAVKLMLQQIQLHMLTDVVRQQARAPMLSSTENTNFFTTTTAFLQGGAKKKASVSQQNVPAWSLFGMFFILIPIASVMIRERTQGIGQRLFLTPVSYFTLFCGRFVAFSVVNLLQLIFMLLVGVYVLPLFGIDKLNLWPNLGPVLVVGICAACAATGFGIFIGTLLRTQQQASFLGPFVIVIGAALGGIFVPVDMMPAVLLKAVNFSPLHWAQKAFLDIFVRGNHVFDPAIYQQLIKLLVFAAVCIVLGTLLGRVRRPHTRAIE